MIFIYDRGLVSLQQTSHWMDHSLVARMNNYNFGICNSGLPVLRIIHCIWALRPAGCASRGSSRCGSTLVCGRGGGSARRIDRPHTHTRRGGQSSVVSSTTVIHAAAPARTVINSRLFSPHPPLRVLFPLKKSSCFSGIKFVVYFKRNTVF